MITAAVMRAGRCAAGWMMAALLLALAACSGPAPPAATPPPETPPAPGRPSTSLPPSPPLPGAQLIRRGSAPETALTRLSAGYNHACGLTETGRAVCWGLSYGELWTAPREERFAEAAAGDDFSCGLTYAGAIQCWGDNRHDRVLGAPIGRGFQAMDVGRFHGCALDAGGVPVCWGRNNAGQSSPPPDALLTEIEAGHAHSCGLTGDGGLQCWGNNGDGRAQGRSGPFQAVAAGWHDTCALRRDGSAFCQGRHSLDPPATAFRQIAVGLGYACGLPIDGGLQCWTAAGVTITQPGDFAALSAGLATPCTLSAAGQPECWAMKSRQPGDSPSGDSPSGDSGESGGAVAGQAYQDFGGGHFRWPVAMFPWPGGGLAVVERQGTISRYFPGNDPAGNAPQPLLDLGGQVACCPAESGMFSVAADPEFERFPFIYVWYSAQRDGLYLARLSRFPAGEGVISPDEELVILEQPLLEKPVLHVGGAIRFGPDGMLYLGLGDNQISRGEVSQNPGALWGSIIRIDVRGATREQSYRIPPDNPLRATPGARPEVWAYGLRNPWRMSFDSQGNLWVGDVGGGAQEEISIATPGANLGWPVFEGRRCHAGEARCAALDEAVPPVFTYERAEGCAIIWGGEYRGRALPQLRGAHLFTDYCTRKVWALESDPATGWQKREIAEVSGMASSFGTDAAGEMYLLLVNGAIVPLTQLIPAEPAEP